MVMEVCFTGSSQPRRAASAEITLVEQADLPQNTHVHRVQEMESFREWLPTYRQRGLPAVL